MAALTDDQIWTLLEAESDVDELIEDEDEVLFKVSQVHSKDAVPGDRTGKY